MSTMADVGTCSVETCSFNHDGCTADAITVGSTGDHATCATFISLGVSGGLPTVRAHVGACQRADCVHNHDLLCHADSVTIAWGGDEADCMTYSPGT
ncbi:DUF1540 domain-containing protein [Nocardioides sp. dk4132]|uniref:DUF1540 domain-containing protein n=1 Tax=unclassified Nocardioides TaxID=2615069 RepID=UPI001297598D|nr:MULTISPECIES: DUF1540 domain-containing protein [unclassified Nocardioides]MQW77792.1 DUF1540 domain-containing protein [Nocardioides sp. dk4132]QGA08188.1 DUF1540 domain-containing protein [Nocardioides sp. dk884]